MEDKPLIEHLDELRKRFFLIIIVILAFFIIGIYFSNIIIDFIVNDLTFFNISIVALSPLEYIYTQIKVGFLFSVVIAFPFIIYEALIFIKPALRSREKNAIKMVLPSFLLLFLIGIVFCYFIFLRIGIFFLANLPIEQVANLWSVNKFIGFVFLLCISFGIIFQMPLFFLILKRMRILDVGFFRKYRKHIYVLIFILAALITPPDIITLIIMVLPLILLYELSLIFIRLF